MINGFSEDVYISVTYERNIFSVDNLKVNMLSASVIKLCFKKENPCDIFYHVMILYICNSCT